MGEFPSGTVHEANDRGRHCPIGAIHRFMYATDEAHDLLGAPGLLLPPPLPDTIWREITVDSPLYGACQAPRCREFRSCELDTLHIRRLTVPSLHPTDRSGSDGAPHDSEAQPKPRPRTLASAAFGAQGGLRRNANHRRLARAARSSPPAPGALPRRTGSLSRLHGAQSVVLPSAGAAYAPYFTFRLEVYPFCEQAKGPEPPAIWHPAVRHEDGRVCYPDRGFRTWLIGRQFESQFVVVFRFLHEWCETAAALPGRS